MLKDRAERRHIASGQHIQQVPSARECESAEESCTYLRSSSDALHPSPRSGLCLSSNTDGVCPLGAPLVPTNMARCRVLKVSLVSRACRATSSAAAEPLRQQQMACAVVIPVGDTSCQCSRSRHVRRKVNDSNQPDSGSLLAQQRYGNRTSDPCDCPSPSFSPPTSPLSLSRPSSTSSQRPNGRRSSANHLPPQPASEPNFDSRKLVGDRRRLLPHDDRSRPEWLLQLVGLHH